jgi:hypothetical protein
MGKDNPKLLDAILSILYTSFLARMPRAYDQQKKTNAVCAAWGEIIAMREAPRQSPCRNTAG